MKGTPIENALLTAWEKTLAERGKQRAILSESGAVLRTFHSIEEEARTLAYLFSHLPPRSVVALQIGNSPAWPALLIALFRRELIPLPLGRHIGAAELELALQTCRAAALVGLDAGAPIVTARDASPVAWDAPIPDFLKLTSGTTSAPRALRFRAPQLVADCDQICDTMGITAADVNFGVIPFSHSYGFSNLVMPLICRGVPLVASDDRMPRAILNALSATRATVFPGMPVFFEKLGAIDTSRPLPALRLCISAGAPLAANVAQRFTKRFGLKVHTFYGSSECGGIAYDASMSTLYEDGYVGTPMCRVTVESSADEVGPIEVRSAAVADGYFPDPMPETLGDGRFIPGDLVRWSARGMYLAGRASELINIAGRKLNPLEIESRIQEYPGIRQAVVFGIPSPLRGEEPIACVAGDGLNSGEVLRFCQKQLSSWQVPKDVWLVGEIPTNERGKISRRALAQSYLARNDRAAAK